VLFVERSGISYTVSQKSSSFLEPLPAIAASGGEEQSTADADCLVLYDSKSSFHKESLNNITATLDSMKVPNSKMSIDQSPQLDFYKYKTIIISLVQLSLLDDQIHELFDWVEEGGKLMFAIKPDNSDTLSAIYPQLGITALDKGLIEVNGIEFLTELLPGTAGRQFGTDFMDHNSLPVDLADGVRLHLISADEIGLPILWESDLGDGKIVFINSDQFIDKASRGIIGAAYSLMHDVVVFPVINASVFYIDDFPAPVPEGKDESIFRQFTRDIESFYLNVWWPDMQDIKDKYNLKYSGFIIETYEYTLQPPFEYTIDQEDIFQYFGGILLRDGGEISLHGYNHIPFCKEEDGINQVLDYPTWSTTKDMQGSLSELQRFSTSMFPGLPFSVYVPVSNILCPEARAWLPEVLPNLKSIASVYLPDIEVDAYVQEFSEADDGIIEFPRIVSGYDPDNFMQWVAANEVWLHYTAAHFVHPDDVLDSYRNKGKSWLDMRETLDEYLLWVYSSMPNVRNLTASEGAMAVQRFARLTPKTDCDEMECRITLDGFHDEGWLLMHTNKVPSTIINGKISQVSPTLYLIEAAEKNILVGFEE